uniref:ADP-ribosyltransferase in polyvalent protein n=1 Tax=Geladintestivirus 5 TaxID=3233137 RepID=A0AAU8MK96_9CAUD
MDVLNFINNGGQKTIPNPNYNPKSKKNIQPPTITVDDLDPERNSVVDMAVYDFNKQYSIGAKEADIYRKEGFNWNPWENLDKQLAEQQGALSKFGNALAQTVVSEIALGTLIGITDLFDMIGQSVGLSDPNYQNNVSKYLTEKQEEFKEATKIWVDPDKNIANGGLTDAGWWASNIPSIASSLTLLIPSTGVVKGLSYIGKAWNISRFTRNAIRAISGAERRLKYARELRAAGATAEEIRAASKLTKMQRFLNSSSTISATNLFLENGTTAALSRAMENYQEARQTYNDMYANASETFKNMNDEEYAKIVERSKDIISANGVDSNDRDAVAKAIAKESADKTFQIDWLNVGWDVLQMYGLRNAWKGLKNAPDNPVSVRRANINAAKYFGKSAEEIAKLKTQRTLSEKFGEKLSDFMYGSKLTIGAELSEGAEEALNYIAQQEGMSFGKVLLGQEQKSNFDTRLSKYIQSPEMYDAAFWGVVGGVVFQGLGSQFRRLSNKLIKDKRANDESKQSLPWYQLDELPEIKRRKAEIEARSIDFETYATHLKKIEKDNVDIYHPNIDGTERKFETESEKQAAKEKLKNEYITKMTLRAMNSGNLDMLKEFIANDDVRKGMVARGIFGTTSETKSEQDIEKESKTYIENALRQINQVEEQYDEEMAALNSAAASINSGKLSDKDELNNTKKRLKTTTFDTIPVEYLQIMAVENVKARTEIANLRTEEVATEQRIADLLNTPGIQENLDKNVDYRNSLKLAIITRELGQLRAERSRLMQDESKNLSNTLAIENIDKNIAALEDLLNDVELVYATGIALQFVSDGDGKYHQEATAESVAYQDAMITRSVGKELGEILNIPGLEHLSKRSRTTLGDEKIAQEKIADQNVQFAISTLKNVSPELFSAYQEIAAIQTRLNFANNDIVRTVDQVKHQAAILNNTMNEARKTAIMGANKILLDMYRKYGNKVLDAIYDKYHVKGSDARFDKTTAEMTSEEKQSLSDAIDVLDLTNDSNKALFDVILERFAIEDAIRASREEETSNEESQSSVINNGTISDTKNAMVDNSSSGTTEAVNGQGNEQIGNVSTPINPQETENRTPTYYTKFYGDKRGNFTSGRHANTDEDSSSIAVYDNEDGTFTLDVRGNKQNLNDTRFFANVNEVDLTRPFEVESKPIAVRNKKGKFVISEPGRLVNTDTAEYQQRQEKQTQQEGSQEVQNEETSGTQAAPTTTESAPATETTTSTPGEESSTNKTQSTTSSTGEQKSNSILNIDAANNYLNEHLSTSELEQVIKGEKFFSYQNASNEDKVKIQELAKKVYKAKTGNEYVASKPKSFEEVINQAPASDEINNESLGKFIAAAKANHDVDLDAMASQLISEYVAKGSDRAIVESAVNKAKNIIQRKLDRLKANNNETTMRSSIDEVLIAQSTITEVISDTEAVKAYKEAVKQMIAQYAKEVGLEELDGKLYINLEDLLRYTNTSTNDSTTSAALFESMKRWLSSFEAKEKYIVTDEAETNKKNFIENTQKTAQERYLERLSDTSVQRVDIQTYVSSLTDPNDVNTFYEALDDLQPGMSLATKVVGSIVHILDGQNRVVGTMPIPRVNATTGAYEMYNDGWKTDVDVHNGSTVSALKDLFTHWLTSKDTDVKQFNSIIFKLAYTNPDVITKKELYAQLENNPLWQAAKARKFMADNANTEKLANGLVKLWKFAKPSSNAATVIQNIQIKESINAWFDKLKHSYDAVSALANGGSLNVSVATISDGELVRAGETKTEAETNALPVDEAIAGGVNPTVHKIAVSDSIIDGQLNVAGAPNLKFPSVGKGNTFVILPNRSGRPGYVHAYPAEVTADYIGQDAKDILKAIHGEITKIINNYNNDKTADNYNKVKTFFKQLLYNKDGNRSLFDGVVYSETSNGFSISIPDTNMYIKFHETGRYGGPAVYAFVGEDNKNIPYDQPRLHQAIKSIINNMKFKLSYAYIASDNVSDQPMNGFANRVNGKFEINIGEKSWSYDSFNEFILNNNLVRLNTKPASDGRSNYERRGQRSQAANQVFEIKITKATTTPVEGNEQQQTTSAPAIPSTPTLSISDKAMNILNGTTSTTNKGLALAELFFDKNTLKVLENLDILPKNITFDSEYNNKPGYEIYNAEVNPRTGEVTVGQKWVDMFNNHLTRAEAIRKLIHEQLHYKLHNKRGYIRSAKEIYNEFKAALDAEGVPANGHMRTYLFEHYPEDEALEEFLVESLTSQELANKLNSIDAQGYDKKRSRNLFQKVLELMSKVFGWGVREGSLYEKELHTLRQNFKDNTEDRAAMEDKNLDSNAQTVLNGKVTADTYKNQNETNTTTQAPITPPTVVPPTTPSQPSQFGTKNSSRLRGKFKRSSITEDSQNSEIASIKEQAIANGTFMKAPNGKPTNLNERQWLQVRTKAFKDWFGDWESVNNLLSNISNVDTNLVDVEEYDKAWKSDPNKSNKTLRIYLKDHSKGYFELVKDKEFGIYSVHFKTAKEGASFNNNAAFSTKEDRKILFKELVKLIPNGAQVSTWGSISNEGIKGLNNVGRDMTKVGERIISSKSTGKNIKIPIYQKGEGVSKVIDENGEPKVFYHYTDNENLNEFDPNFNNYFTTQKNGTHNAFFFTEKQSDGLLGRTKELAVFLNIRDLEVKHGTKDELRAAGEGFVSTVNRVADQKKGDYNGVMFTGFDDNRKINQTVIVATRPNQIKSATDNIGTFSTTDDNIRHSSITEQSAKVASVSTFTDRLPISQQAKFATMVSQGDIKTSCV